jgi:hypothetical protein
MGPQNSFSDGSTPSPRLQIFSEAQQNHPTETHKHRQFESRMLSREDKAIEQDLHPYHVAAVTDQVSFGYLFEEKNIQRARIAKNLIYFYVLPRDNYPAP